MSNQDIQSLFDRLKATESKEAPGFDEILNKIILVKEKERGSIQYWKILLAAASVIFVILASYYSSSFAIKKENLMAEELEFMTEETTIMEWESSTDEWLLTELNNDDEKSQTINKQESLSASEEIVEPFKKIPELESIEYEKGALSEWQSPTVGLMPF